MIKSLLPQSTALGLPPFDLGLPPFGLGMLVVGAIAIASPAQAANLGAANDYNIFILGDMAQSNVDSWGKVAVSGNVTLSSFQVGTKLPKNSGAGDSLIVGKDLKYSQGNVNGNVVVNDNADLKQNHIYGNVTVGKAATLEQGTVEGSLKYGTTITQTGGNTVKGTTTSGADTSWVPGFFSDASTYLNTLSNSLKTATSGSGLSVLNWDSGIQQHFNFTGLGNTDTILVNIGGTSLSWSGGLQWNGTSLSDSGCQSLGVCNRILYNFYEATDLTISSIGVGGSILAPKAKIKFNNGQVNGTVIGAGLEGNGETHNFGFTGSVPDPGTAVPTPALLPGLIGLGASIWRKKRQAVALNKAT